MSTLIDPRPMEPAWVAEHEPSGLVDWKTERLHWSREHKCREIRTEYHEGRALELISYIGGLTLSPAFEPCCVIVDASQAVMPQTNPPAWYNVKHSEENIFGWSIKYTTPDCSIESHETGTDVSELMGWVAYLLEQNAIFTLDLEIDDPTPQYSEIGSMF